MHRLIPILLSGGVLFLAGCDDGPANALGDLFGDGGTTTPIGDQQGDPCGGLTSQSCTCANGALGTQSCVSGNWTACACAYVPPAVDSGIGGTGGLCKAGYYTGNFTGQYWPGIGDPTLIFGGGGSVGSLLEVTVNAKAGPDSPGLALTLDQQATQAGEFVTYTVKNGCVVGTAEAFGTTNPFIGVLTGDLDCMTGEFTGTLKGYYKLFGFSELPFGFEGPVSGQYYAQQEKLDDGMWMVEEESQAAMPPGGSGSWQVYWDGPVDSAPPLPEECVEFLAGEVDTTSSDAVDGGTATTTDAGTGDAGVADGG